MTFLTQEQLDTLGFKALGKAVQLSDKASIYNPGAIAIGDYTRIDDFVILSAGEGGITLGRNVHIACYCSLIGQGHILLEDFSGLSSRTSVYSSNDDYTGVAMSNPTLPAAFTKVTSAPVILRRHVMVGCGAVILPGVELKEGAVLGAMSLARKDCESFGIYFGIPARKVADRQRDLLALEQEYLATLGANDSGFPAVVFEEE